MHLEENHTLWLEKMKLFCEELAVYLNDCRYNIPLVLFSKSMPVNENGEFDNLCEMSTQCNYVSNIDILQHTLMIFDIQSMARRLLMEIGKHPMMTFQSNQQELAFFERPLLVAISLGVEHQMNANHGRRMDSYPVQSKTRCS
jgi:hypothetical protein